MLNGVKKVIQLITESDTDIQQKARNVTVLVTVKLQEDQIGQQLVTHSWPVWLHDDTTGAIAEHSLNCRAGCGHTLGSHCWVWPDYAARIQGCSQDQQWQDQDPSPRRSSQDQDQDQDARTFSKHRLLSSLSLTSCLSHKLLNKISSSLSPCLCQNYLVNFHHHHRPRHVCNVFIYIFVRKNTFNSFIQATYHINTIVLFSEVETRPSRLNVDYRLPAFCLLAL